MRDSLLYFESLLLRDGFPRSHLRQFLFLHFVSVRSVSRFPYRIGACGRFHHFRLHVYRIPFFASYRIGPGPGAHSLLLRPLGRCVHNPWYYINDRNTANNDIQQHIHNIEFLVIAGSRCRTRTTGPLSRPTGIVRGAGRIVFAYLGFDVVNCLAEDPQGEPSFGP